MRMIRHIVRHWLIRSLGAECIDSGAAAQSVRQSIEELQ